MNNLKVSIITVSYNSVNTIERTIQSVISQTYDNIEYIIIDGCSTDNTQEIIRRYESHISYWVSEADGGIYDAMNKGIKHATGDIIGILNSDDRYHSDHIIETIVNKYSCSDCPCIIHGDICYFTSDNSSFILKPITRQDQIRKEPTYLHPTMFVPRSFYVQYGKYDTGYKIAADYDMMLRLYLYGCKFIYIDYIIVDMYSGGESDKKRAIGFIESYRISRKGGTCLLPALATLFRRFVYTFINDIRNSI
jgi:glycosyltransferase involved in cell wall biosynthesis